MHFFSRPLAVTEQSFRAGSIGGEITPNQDIPAAKMCPLWPAKVSVVAATAAAAVCLADVPPAW